MTELLDSNILVYRQRSIQIVLQGASVFPSFRGHNSTVDLCIVMEFVRSTAPSNILAGNIVHIGIVATVSSVIVILVMRSE